MSLLLICAHTDILVLLVFTALRAPDSGGAQAGGDGEGRVRMYFCPPLFRPSPSVTARGLRGRFCCRHVRHRLAVRKLKRDKTLLGWLPVELPLSD